MKKFKLLPILCATFMLVAGLAACDGDLAAINPSGPVGSDWPQLNPFDPSVGSGYSITLNADKSFVLEVGDEVDFTQYFSVRDEYGHAITVTEAMLDLRYVNTSVTGSFKVTLSIGGATRSARFLVVPKGSLPTDPASALENALSLLDDRTSWNFAVTRNETRGEETESILYEYLGRNTAMTYSDRSTGSEASCTDYIVYSRASESYSYYLHAEDGYEIFEEGTAAYEEQYESMHLIDFTELKRVKFDTDGIKLTAQNAAIAGKGVLGAYVGDTEKELRWTSFEVYLANNRIARIAAEVEDGTSVEYSFSKYGTVSFTAPSAGQSEAEDPDITYPSPLQEKMLEPDENGYEGWIGLPSTGAYHVLVVPVQFKGDPAFTSSQLNDLEICLNGSAAETGWESVRSFYQKSSYGRLNLTFDIVPTFTTSQRATYYERLSANGQYGTEGTNELLDEALAHYDSSMDLTVYDHNGDQTVDAVYLIYSHDVDYEQADFFWAYTTSSASDELFDGLYPGYYFFAGIDFMAESTAQDNFSGYDWIPGLKINAATFIHESGHLLGLDDYYDTNENKGGNKGLGGADMMDYNVGDHDVYSKTMLGWMEPQVVRTTSTVTLKPSVSEGSAILVPLDYDNTYFSEYLLIDLYSATGLNALHAESTHMSGFTLYDGAEYGVRIYHVSSSADDPYSNDYGSLTDYNNSTTTIPLIKLVEADGGDSTFRQTDDCAAASDLWQAGQTFSSVFRSYTRNDGRSLGFDIRIVSVSGTQATVEITFNS